MPSVAQRQFDPNVFAAPEGGDDLELEAGGYFTLEDLSGIIQLES